MEITLRITSVKTMMAARRMAKKVLYNLLLRMVENLYSERRTILIVEKPFQTRPVLSSTKKAPGFCIVCGAPATTEALFKVVGAIIIQRYCDKCLSGAKY